MTSLAEFRTIWLVDFEFHQPPGERPQPICLVARELREGLTVRLWEDELRSRSEAPYSTALDSLVVAFYASAEVGCHLSLGWPVPRQILDLYVEFRNATNGADLPGGAGLLGALLYFGLPGIGSAEKESMRQLAIRGGPFSPEERAGLLTYCESDVVALERLFSRMASEIDLPRALPRGRYMTAAARMEGTGVPIDRPSLDVLQDRWAGVQDELISKVDASYGVYEGRAFRASRFREWLAQRRMPWPCLPSGALALDKDTFRDMARSFPEVAPLQELRTSLGQMRLADLAVGRDNRNRVPLWAFKASTGRNQPSNSQFIFGPSVWLRGLIMAPAGAGIASADWCQQEFGISAALSGDEAMMRAYNAGDPYLMFAKQAGAVPPSATKASHGPTRELFKQCSLAVLYGMGAESLAVRIRRSTAEARELITLHQRTYPAFWRWSQAAENFAVLTGHLHTVFGWRVHVHGTPNPRSLRNFPVQANGAEMLRLAASLATERGIQVCAPVHDALLVEAPAEMLSETVRLTQELMAEASELVLSGFRLRSDVAEYRAPDRYMNARGEAMWNTVWGIIADQDGRHRNNTCAPMPTRPVSSIGSPL